MVCSCPTTATGVALTIQLLYREGFARLAAGCQHQDPRGPSPPTRPTSGHLDSSNQSSLKGHSPALSATSGARHPCGTSGSPGWQRPRGLRPSGSGGGGSCHNPGASRSPLGTLPSHPARVAGFHGGGRARGLAWGRGRASQETEGPAGQRVQGHSDPEHQEIILYNHPKQRYFLKSLNYFQLFGDDPAFFFSPQTSCQ